MQYLLINSRVILNLYYKFFIFIIYEFYFGFDILIFGELVISTQDTKSNLLNLPLSNPNICSVSWLWYERNPTHFSNSSFSNN